MPRKIVQIATAGERHDYALFALANDGTLWELDYRIEGNWTLVPSLPDRDEDVVF